MPVLGPDDPLPRRPSRVLVAGSSGSGKTTLAGRIGRALGIPHIEIDGLFHGPGWVPRPGFVEDVHRFAATPAWVTEWQYRAVRPLLADRAELMVWLDLGRAQVMRQVVPRTLRRRLTHERLWHGNVEPPLWTFLTDREHIVRWTWRTHGTAAERVATAMAERPELVVVRLTDRRGVDRWVTGPLADVARPQS